MLKLTYSSTDISLEHLNLTVESVVIQRSLVAMRAGHPLVVQPSYGSFSLPAGLPGIAVLRAIAPGNLELAACDDHWLEVTLRGTWLADGSGGVEGILVVELGAKVEHHLLTLWQQSLTWLAAPCSQGR